MCHVIIKARIRQIRISFLSLALLRLQIASIKLHRYTIGPLPCSSNYSKISLFPRGTKNDLEPSKKSMAPIGYAILIVQFLPLAFSTSFRIEIEPGREECFFIDVVDANKILKVNYAVLSATQGDLDIDFEFSGPTGQPPLFERRKTLSHHRYPAVIPGSYKACFSNGFSHFSKKTVSFSMIIEKDSQESLWNSYDVKELLPEEDETVKIEDFHERTDKVRVLLKEVTDIQEDFGQVESRDRCTAEHNFERVNFWSTVYLIVLISVGITQVLLVKGFFDEKYAIGRIFQYLLRD